MYNGFEESAERAYDGKIMVWHRYPTYSYREKVNGKWVWTHAVWSWVLVDVRDS